MFAQTCVPPNVHWFLNDNIWVFRSKGTTAFFLNKASGKKIHENFETLLFRKWEKVKSGYLVVSEKYV